MLELQMYNGFLAFDGTVVESFDELGNSNRYHVRYIQKFETQRGTKDALLLSLRYGKNGRSGFSSWMVADGQDVDGFVRAVMAAKG
jgi:hypothetical protein